MLTCPLLTDAAKGTARRKHVPKASSPHPCADLSPSSLFSAGKGDEVAALLAQVRATAESAEEPNALTYRTIRSEDNPDDFIIFEEYVMPNGLTEHGEHSRFLPRSACCLRGARELTPVSVQSRARRSRRSRRPTCSRRWTSHSGTSSSRQAIAVNKKSSSTLSATAFLKPGLKLAPCKAVIRPGGTHRTFILADGASSALHVH